MYPSFVTILSIVGFVAAQDCTDLLSGNGKRFILDTVGQYFNSLPKEIQAILPGNSELNAKCRFDLTNLQDSHRATLKTLYDDGYSICVGCGYKNSDHGRCHSIDVCAKGSKCISGKNEQRAPTYYWHACCDPANRECATRTESVQFHISSQYNPSLNYIKKACDTPLCNENGYTQEKNALIQYLTSSPSVTSAPAGPTDGGWTGWSNWGSCDKSCDIGARYRTRACTAPIPQNGGAQCQGVDNELEICNAFACA